MKSKLAAAILFSIPAWLHAQGGPNGKEIADYYSRPTKQLKSYSFDPKVRLAKRIGPCPPFLLAAMREMDGKSDYEAYAPSKEEAELVQGYLKKFPSKMRKVFDERLVGIYFIKNFTGNGMADWIRDENGEVYGWLIMNPVGFERTISETLTKRDSSVFKGEAAVAIDAGSAYKGILYTILHEGTHVYDYIRGITPFTDYGLLDFMLHGRGADAAWDVWEGYGKPGKSADFPLRAKVKFYGLDGGPLIDGREASKAYEQLKSSPFASLYGSQSWAEDSADLVTLYHVTHVLKQPYSIRTGDVEIKPLESGEALRRAQRLYRDLSAD
jgi:hypothetical protein